jgi:hypothetical protein
MSQASQDPHKILAALQQDSKDKPYNQLVTLLKSNDAEACQFVINELQQFLDVVLKDIENEALYVSFAQNLIL